VTAAVGPSGNYYNPVGFRTELPPPVTAVDEVMTQMVRFRTDRQALRQLIPSFFELPDEPVITVAHAHNIGVDWLAGRTYRLARVDTQVTYRGEEETVTGPFTMVVWESDPRPVIVGRELQGYQKLVGNVPPHDDRDGGGSFECYEYEARLFRGELRDLEPVSAEGLARMQAGLDRAGHVTLGWKYIPKPEGGADVDYVTRLPMRARLAEVRQGAGTVAFDSPAWEEAPGSAHIVAALKSLPILEWRSAVATRMVDVTLPRGEARRIR